MYPAALVESENYTTSMLREKGLHDGLVSNLWLVLVCQTDKEQGDLCSVKSYNKPNTRSRTHMRG